MEHSFWYVALDSIVCLYETLESDRPGKRCRYVACRVKQVGIVNARPVLIIKFKNHLRVFHIKLFFYCQTLNYVCKFTKNREKPIIV